LKLYSNASKQSLTIQKSKRTPRCILHAKPHPSSQAFSAERCTKQVLLETQNPDSHRTQIPATVRDIPEKRERGAPTHQEATELHKPTKPRASHIGKPCDPALLLLPLPLQRQKPA
jgi:hypothetical protein